MVDDASLLRKFVGERSEIAFREFVGRHIDFVYATALRCVGGDAHHAADVSQYVFAAAAKQASSLGRHRSLKGWLYSTTRNAAANLVRMELRRRTREREAHGLQNLNQAEAMASPDDLKPVIDTALCALNEQDREFVLLRFFEGCPYPEIGARFSVTADAARLRIERSIEKMKSALERKGVTSTTAALTATLAAQAAVVAPVGLATSATSAGVASAVLIGGGAASTALFMSTTKLVTAGALVLALGFSIYEYRRADDTAQLLQVANSLAAQTEQRSTATERRALELQSEIESLRVQLTDLSSRLAKSERPPPPTVTPTPLVAAPELVPVSTLTNAGRATPSDALQTMLWAAQQNDNAVFASVIAFGSDLRPLAVASFEQIPADVRAARGIASVEEMAAMLLRPTVSSLTAFRTTEQPQADPNSVTINCEYEDSTGKTGKFSWPFQRYEDGWRYVVPNKAVGDLLRVPQTFKQP